MMVVFYDIHVIIEVPQDNMEFRSIGIELRGMVILQSFKPLVSAHSTRIAISVEVRREYIVFRRIFRIVSVVSAGVSVVTVELSVVSLMFLSCFRQVAILSGLPFSWSCLIYSRAVMAGVCDFENVKRYNVKTLTG